MIPLRQTAGNLKVFEETVAMMQYSSVSHSSDYVLVIMRTMRMMNISLFDCLIFCEFDCSV